ncbi:MAG: DUF3592 domain-containing protein [Candidatus Saccharibacteria bacterium]|nr:DUF3592 domain-containing protein [Candidatus Saccharibacteria bacterium]
MATTKSESAKSNRQRRMVGAMFRPMCKILILIGVATLLLAVATLWQYQASTRRTAKTTGEITDVRKVGGIGRDENGNDNQKCRIKYKFVVNDVTYTDSLGYRGNPTAAKCQLKRGDTIDIQYDTSHPANSAYQVDEDNSNHGTLGQTIESASSIAFVGVIPIVIGIVGLRLAREHRTKTNKQPKKEKSSRGHKFGQD